MYYSVCLWSLRKEFPLPSPIVVFYCYRKNQHKHNDLKTMPSISSDFSRSPWLGLVRYSAQAKISMWTGLNSHLESVGEKNLFPSSQGLLADPVSLLAVNRGDSHSLEAISVPPQSTHQRWSAKSFLCLEAVWLPLCHQPEKNDLLSNRIM